VPEILFGSYREKIQAIWEFVKGKKFRYRVGRKVWDSYFKFCFERNPWDKTVSHFYWNRAKPGKGDLMFEQYVKRGADIP
jgi:tRNA splicing ligase